VLGFTVAYAMGVKNIPVRSLKNGRYFMDHCFLHRIAGGKPHLKKSKPAGFGTFERSKVQERYTA